ncbi:hypothetical protein U1Q18_007153 [Sarracenia purpurea var. burkii]
MLRRSASSVVPLAIRVVGSQRYLISAGRRHRQLSRSAFSPVLHFSSTSKRPTSDESLLKVIQGEIQYAEESDDHGQVEDVPDDFHVAPLRRRFYAAAPRHRGGRLRSPPLVASDLRLCNHSAPPLHHCSTQLPRATARPLLRNRAAAPPRKEPSKPLEDNPAPNLFKTPLPI